MSREHPAQAAGPPGKHSLPPEAEQEIMETLCTNLRISSGREELRNVEVISAKEKTEQPQAGDVDENVLGFLLSLQNDGGDK